MQEIIVSQLNPNEDTYTVMEISRKRNDWITKGEIIASLYSSKLSEDVVSPADGYLYIAKEQYEEVRVGDILAILFETKEELKTHVDEKGRSINHETASQPFQLTRKAREFAEENHITEAEIRKIGKNLIKRADLEKMIAARTDEKNDYELPLNQADVSMTVVRSHADIPQAFQITKIDCSSKSEYISKNKLIGYTELLVLVVRKLFDEFPVFFSRYVGKNKVCMASAPVIGVTMDAGNGLFVPVLKEEELESLEQISKRMFEHKKKAILGSFHKEELTGGNFSITQNTEHNVVSVVPLILPGQVAMLSVGAPIKELAFDDEKEIVEKTYLYLGLAYDHRVINGFQAMRFMNRLTEIFQNEEIGTSVGGCM